MSNEIQQGLQDDLTTIEPDLMNMTRLFSLPDSVWDAPEYHFAAAIEGGQYVIRFYGKTQAAQGVTDIPSDADARIQALHRRRRFAASAVRRSTTCCARKQAFIRRGGA